MFDTDGAALAILPSRMKAMGLVGICAVLPAAGVQRAMEMRALDGLAIAGFALFGAAGALFVISLVVRRPLLRATYEGIEYFDLMQPLHRHGHVPWSEVRGIELRPGSSGFMGRSKPVLKLTGPHPNLYIAAWQVPRSTKETLRQIAWRFQQQIERYGVIIGGIE